MGAVVRAAKMAAEREKLEIPQVQMPIYKVDSVIGERKAAVEETYKERARQLLKKARRIKQRAFYKQVRTRGTLTNLEIMWKRKKYNTQEGRKISLRLSVKVAKAAYETCLA